MSQITPRVISTCSHTGEINALAFSPDGQRVATASDDKTVQIRALADGSLLSTLTADVPLQRVSFSPDGKLVAASGFASGVPPRCQVVVFNATTGVQLWKRVPNLGLLMTCVFSADRAHVVLFHHAIVQVCDAQTGTEQWHLDMTAHQVLNRVALSFDGATVALGLGINSGGGSVSGEIMLLDAASGAMRRQVEMTTQVRAVGFSASRGLLAFGADDEIGVLDLASNALRVLPNPTVPHHGNLREVLSIAFSPDDTSIGVVSVTINGINPSIDVLGTAAFDKRVELPDGFSSVFGFSPDSRSALSAENNADVRVWDVTTGAEQFKLLQNASGVNVAAFGPTGVTAAVASGNTATLLELAVPELFRFTHEGPVHAVAFSADGSRVLTGSQDTTARVFDVTSGTQQSRLPHDGPVNSVAWLPANPWVATASADHNARIFDPATATERARITHADTVNTVTISADGQRLASAADDAEVRLTDVTTGNLLRRFNHNGPVRAVAFSPDGTRLATGSDDGNARLFNTATGATLITIPHGAPVVALAFNPDGTQLATGCADNSARVFNPASGAQACNVTCAGPVRAVVFSPDGSQLAVGSDDTSARIVRADTGAELHHFTHGGAVQALAYQPAGKLLVTGSADATARVFDTGTGTQLRSFAHDGAVHAVSVDPAGTTLATASEDKTARLYPLPR